MLLHAFTERMANLGESDSVNHPSSFDAAEIKLWSMYIEQAEKTDQVLAGNWKGQTDSTLIFVRLLDHALLAHNIYTVTPLFNSWLC